VAAEIMRVTGTIRDCIIDHERIDEILDLIHDGREQYGSQTFDQHLIDLVNEGSVSFAEAKKAANSPSDFDLKMNMLGGTGTARGSHHGGTDGFSA
jgi:twitching motility protein PilT